ncbi:MAG: sulfite exporter TauE/SafE family protein, partial [Bacteroidota bacterium]
MEWYYYVIIIGGSAFAGALNTLAGNGSAITLTILTELLQLHGNLANGTNRVGIFMQSLAGSIAFYRNGKLRLDRGGIYIVCTLIGAIIGIIAANLVSSEQFKSVFRFLMVLMLLVLLVKPKRWLQATDNQYQMKIWLTIPAFLALGFYGGFIQMGMGVFFLAAMVLGARFSIMESNAIKIFVVGLYTLLAIAIFQWNGLIDWKVGLLMAIGQTTGGWFTAHYASKYPGADIW